MSEKSPYTPSHTPDAVKVPPHSMEAEQSILGGLLLDNEAWDVISSKVSEHDFYRHEHKLIFAALRNLAEKQHPMDVVTVVSKLKSLGELEKAGGEVYLYELSSNVPSAANLKAYADIVRERSVLRQLISVAQEVADVAYNPGGRASNDLLDDAERKVFEIAEQTAREGGPKAIASYVTKAVDKVDKLFHSDSPITGLPTGYTDFDNMTAGLQESDLIIIAGRPSMGKTGLAMNVAEHAAIYGDKPVLVFSMEMPGEALALRMLSSLGRIDQHRLRSGKLHDDDWPRISNAVSLLSQAKLFIDDTAGLTPSEVRSRARRLAREHGQLGLIVIDYLQLMHSGGRHDNRSAELSEISRSLKGLAKELNVPLIALSQLNRSLEQRADRRPVMSDLRESGAIEQDADLIAFIYRDEVYHPDTREKGIAEILIRKQRNGPIGNIKLAFLGQYTRFENLSREAFHVPAGQSANTGEAMNT